jgi:hypothetical protein
MGSARFFELAVVRYHRAEPHLVVIIHYVAIVLDHFPQPLQIHQNRQYPSFQIPTPQPPQLPGIFPCQVKPSHIFLLNHSLRTLDPESLHNLANQTVVLNVQQTVDHAMVFGKGLLLLPPFLDCLLGSEIVLVR